MNIAKKSINKLCAILVIIALTCTDFLLVGTSLVSYAVDAVKTNSTNVDFSAYFVNEDGEKTEETEVRIDEEEIYLYVDISVYNEGYFNGNITISNSNLKIKNEILSSEVSEISGNTVTLNQINAGSTATIKLAIEPVIEDTITREVLTTETNISLSGEYVNSKNVEKSKFVEVEGNTDVTITWLSSEETNIEMKSSLLTNSIYDIDGEEKRIVQVLVESKITDNNYPVYSTKIEATVLENVEEVTVSARSMEATNANTEFEEENYEYNEQEGKVEINITNADTSEISWVKDSEDTFVITYVMDVNSYIEEKSITITGTILTYDNKEFSQSQDVQIEETESIDGVISYEIETKEESIYKGKLYTGESRDYIVIDKINVNYLNIVDSITVKGNAATYEAGEQEGEANIVYSQTKIKKEDITTILGEEGYIIIKDSAGNTIANINKDSETDEEGYVIINYFENTKNIEITTSEPKTLGTIEMENTKTIESTGYSKDTITSLTGIKEKITGTDNGEEVSQETKITLKNTSSEASLDVSAETLSTTETNENVKITAILLNNDESKDLYQNPTIKIELPEQVTEVSAKCKVLYGNGLELSTAKIIEENGKYVIEIGLTGEQTTYNTEVLEGTTIIIYANMEINQLAADSEEEIRLTYTNEKAMSYADDGTQTKQIKIASNQGVITANSIDEYDVETIGDQGTETITLDIGSEKEDATVSIDVVNNEGTQINNVAILGTFPTNTNLGISLSTGITLLSEQEGIEVYYSDESDPTTDVEDSNNGWSEKGNAETAQSYLILVDSMEIGESFSANYEISIPSDLTYDLTAEESYTVTYTNSLTSAQKNANSTIVTLSTGTGADIDTTLKAYVGGDEISNGDTVYTGEVVTYELTLTNNGTETASNLDMQIAIPENTTCVEYVKSTEVQETEEELIGTTDYYENVETTNNILTKNFETLEVGETKTITYDVKINDEAATNEISSYATINYNATTNNTNTTTVSTDEITNVVSDAEITMSMVMVSRGETVIESGLSYSYELTVANVSSKNLSNVSIKIDTNSLYTLENVINNSTDEVLEISDNVFTISSLKEGETATFEIDVMLDGAGNPTIRAIANELYRSNMITETSEENKVEASMSSENEGKKVNNGEAIIYNVEITNTGDDDIEEIYIEQTISEYLEVQSVTINGEQLEVSDFRHLEDEEDEEDETEEDENVDAETEEDEVEDEDTEAEEENEEIEAEDNVTEEAADDDLVSTEESEQYSIGYYYESTIASGEKLSIEIATITDENDVHEDDINIVSKAEISSGLLAISTEEVNHILSANVDTSNNDEENQEEEDSEIISDPTADDIVDEGTDEEDNENSNTSGNSDSDNSSDNETTNNGSTITEETESYVISGTAWLDEDENGGRDSGEETLSGIGVTLLNIETNETVSTSTLSSGFYSFTEVQNGKYVVIFDYDTENYILTTYRADGINDNRNSDVEHVNLSINGETQYVSATDTITIDGNSSTNVDIGLVEAKTYDLSLTKTISKVTVTNSAGTTTNEYDDTSLAKVEIKSKYLSGSTVVIEYKIKVTNEGEIAGYVKNIVDYKPSDLTFNSSLNSDWYQSGEYLYSKALANEKIEPGETKELTLVLTKTMTESNTGLVSNMAEISEDYNSRGISDTDSTAGNKSTSEDDLGQANVIISVSTGAAVSYISITLVFVAIIAAGAFIVTRKVLRSDANFWDERRRK